MATIRTAIALYDGVTAPLMHMNRALHVVLNSFEAMQAASAHPVDTAAIRQAREELARAETTFDSIEEAIRRGERRQRGFNQSVRDGTQAAGGLLSRVRQIGAAVGGAIAVRRLVGISDTLTGTTARLNLLADDGGSVEELEQKIMASAMRSRSAYFDTAQMVAKMGLNAGAAFESNDELIAFAEQVNKQFIIGGANAVEQKNAIIQLTQAMAAGALRGEELNSILEGAPGIARAIEQYMGIAEGSIKKYASQGLVTAEVVKNALFSVADETNRKFESMPLTWSQVFTMAGNVALTAFQPLFKGINKLANHIDIIGPAVLGLAAAFAVFQIAANSTRIATFFTGIYTGVLGLLKFAYAALTGQTYVATAATAGFMGTLLANPVTWVVMIILLLVGALYAGVAAFNHFTGAGVSATGIICGAFGVLLAFVGNILIALNNAAADAANFIANVFHGRVEAIKVFFYDLAITVVGYLRNMAQAAENLLNGIFGIQADITGSLGMDDLYGDLQQRSQKAKTNSGWVEYVEKQEYLDYASVARKGYDMGAGAVDWVKDKLGIGTPDAFDDLYSAAADTAGNTAKMANAMEAAEEDLKYLRDIAEREAINRFTTAEIRIEQHNENHIGSGMDVDGIMDKWCGTFAEQLNVQAEGVHV